MVMSRLERRVHIKRVLLRRNGYQFGQRPSSTTLVQGGAVACCDTSIQMVLRIARGEWYSLNEIRRRSWAPEDEPMNSVEALRALNSFGLDYHEISPTPRDLYQIVVDKGPVIIAEAYWSHPQWEGYVYGGRKLTGNAKDANGDKVFVGFSKPLSHSGLNQPTFRDGHAVLVATADMIDGKMAFFERDPNHDSPARPERPAWDRVSAQQLARQLSSFRSIGNRKVALVPRRPIL